MSPPMSEESPEHPKDPLQEKYGWEEMGHRIRIRCFQDNPSLKSSLTFLRKTPWAREKVEAWYVWELRRDARGRER